MVEKLTAAGVSLREQWYGWSVWTDFHRDICHLLEKGAYYEGPNDHQVYPPMVYCIASDLCCLMSRIFKMHKIAATTLLIPRLPLSTEVKALFYDEDTSVDIKHGLWWKVKKGMRTREQDDPCPAE